MSDYDFYGPSYIDTLDDWMGNHPNLTGFLFIVFLLLLVAVLGGYK